ncbi:MAG: hypothetical protein KatS3mg057_1265 [Herpetosiphonaceae bacterium]|nr:MAG: hypothetical protein KatS3mg057_1265 [Herpetosiphonaceae bacterium]
MAELEVLGSYQEPGNRDRAQAGNRLQQLGVRRPCSSRAWISRSKTRLCSSNWALRARTGPPAFDPARPDQNVATFYGYDGLGRTAFVTETGILTGTFDPATRTFSAATARVTRTEYDALSRPVTVTLNDQPGVPAGPDVNVQTLTVYDAAGNITWQRDSLGRWTFTEYDALNRPVTVTVNYENGDPVSIDPANAGWTTLADTDLLTVTHSTAAGQVARVIENHVDGRFTSSEPITDMGWMGSWRACCRTARSWRATRMMGRGGCGR